MRVRLVTQWYPPEPAGVQAGIARGLLARGHEVDVLTGFPNYPTGELYPDFPLRPYRRDVERTDLGDIVIHRAPLYPSHDTSAARRMANYLSFATASTAVGLTRGPRPDVWLTYSSPVTAAFPALGAGMLDSVRRRLGRTGTGAHAQIIQDLWPDSVTHSGFVDAGRAVQAMESALTRYCEFAYRHTAAIGVISPGMRRVLVDRGVPDAAIVDTPNAVDASPLPRLGVDEARAARRELGLPDHGRLFVYAGNLGELQALPALVEGFEQVPDASLALIGPGVMRDRLAARIGASDRIRVLPAQPADRIGRFLALADVLVVSLADLPLLRVTMPSKVASCLGSGRPVLAHAVGDAAEVVTDAGGMAATPGNTEELASAIMTMAAWDDAEFARRDAAARAWYEANADTETCRDALDGLVTLAAHRARHRPATSSTKETP